MSVVLIMEIVNKFVPILLEITLVPVILALTFQTENFVQVAQFFQCYNKLVL